ncbi:endonuclease/exonuclease/phosphatase family protein [Marinimicrobium sp. ABcell2]|uniref:endonuclease/exonuclease/phosphatase family protein n=1 Tax=Marinimicrobium sp. ABcell2 TaxID=3069751 RepID=UPI0027B16C82|nr:endonuclease/exonuclease/phosphatase family protein [Marinimicrobium sp. ABcell2]MDQ2075784.1 endonuclease/exonuclease/phosphatase family protein [Marinimicrobium sp. ABcell2]
MSRTVRILTVNTHKGFTLFNRRFILHELREAVRAVSADVVFLQEVMGEHKSWSSRHKGLWPIEPHYEFLADSIWQDFAYGRNAVYPQGHHGNALLSKFPIVSWDNHDISLNRFEQRGLLHCKLDMVDASIQLHAICVHLNLREGDRQRQLLKLCELVNSIPESEPVVVAGDFNDWRCKSQAVLLRQAGLHEVFTDIYGQPPRSFPAVLPMLRLDRIYVRSAQFHTPLVLPNKPWSHLSDHKPLMAEVEF